MELNMEKANELLKKYISGDRLQNHCYIVSNVMGAFAKDLGEDEEYWRAIGLLHDIDYEKYPEEHCVKCEEILESEGISEDAIKSIQSHGYGLTMTNVEPQKQMEKVLFTIDELTGLIFSTALMMPDKKIANVELKSVIKKFKTPSFSAKVDRQVILNGCEMLGMDLEQVTQKCLDTMKEIAPQIGL